MLAEYFKHSHQKTFRTEDGFVRRRLRSILRRQTHRKGSARAYGADQTRWPIAYFDALGANRRARDHHPRGAVVMELEERSELTQLVAIDAATPMRVRESSCCDHRLTDGSPVSVIRSSPCSADMLTLIHTFKLNSVDRQAWFADVFLQIVSTNHQSSRPLLSALTTKETPGPHRWHTTQQHRCAVASPWLRSFLTDGSPVPRHRLRLRA
jgi:hypothetical protein